MLAGFEHGLRFVRVKVIRSADVDNINVGVARKFIERLVSSLKTKAATSFFGSFRRTPKKTSDGNAPTTERFEVSAPHEPQSDNRSLQRFHFVLVHTCKSSNFDVLSC
jgi:hypothetical protein